MSDGDVVALLFTLFMFILFKHNATFRLGWK